MLRRYLPGIFALLLLVSTLAACSTPQAPELVDWKLTQSNNYVMSNAPSDHVIDVEVTAKLPDELAAHIPLNMAIVVDHSGSMSGEQMDDAKRALKYMLRQLKPEDNVSVIAFSSRVEVLQEQSEWDDVDAAELNSLIDGLQPRGTTAMVDALRTGYSQVLSRYDSGMVNRIILLSDGIPNDPTDIMRVADDARASNIPITTMGLGPYYNEDLMANLADHSGGNYVFIRNSKELEKAFVAEVQSMEQVVARNVSVQFSLGPGTEFVQAYGGQAQINGRNVTVFLGDLSVTETRQLGLNVRVNANASGAKVEVLDAQLTYEDVVAWTGYQEAWAYLEAQSTKDQALIDKSENKLVAERVGKLQAAVQIQEAVDNWGQGNRDVALEQLRSAQSTYKAKRSAASDYVRAKQKLERVQTVAGSAPDEPAPAPMAGEERSYDFDDDTVDGTLSSTIEAIESEEDNKSDRAKVIVKDAKARSRVILTQ